MPAPITDTGLPPISTGPAIQLENLPITTHDVDRHHVASVALADPTAQANLDAWLASQAWCHGRVQLAIDGFVSWSCTYLEPAAGHDFHRAMNARITPSGRVEDQRFSDLFVPPLDELSLTRACSGDWEIENAIVGFDTHGALIRDEQADDAAPPVHVPWRVLAPMVRADGPLGPVLTAAGLTVAPAGAVASIPRARELDVTTRGLRSPSSGFPTALRIAERLPDDVLAATRLRASAAATTFVLPDGVDPALLPPHFDVVDGYRYGALADLVWARVTSGTELHDDPSPHGPVFGAVPAGAFALAARGPVGGRELAIGSGWSLLAADTEVGYAQGRAVAVADGCVPRVDGMRGITELGPDQRMAWSILRPDMAWAREVTLFALADDCTVGEPLRHATVRGTITDLRVVRANETGDPWLLVLTTADGFETAARTITVFGPTPDAAPLYTATSNAPVVTLAESHGPGGAPGYFPIATTTGRTRTWLAWNGTTLEPQP